MWNVTGAPALAPSEGTATLWLAFEKPGQDGDIHSYFSRLVARQLLGSRAPARLILEIDIGEFLAVAVAHDKAGVQFLGSPRRPEAAGAPHSSCKLLPIIGRAEVAFEFLQGVSK